MRAAIASARWVIRPCSSARKPGSSGCAAQFRQGAMNFSSSTTDRSGRISTMLATGSSA